METLEIGLVIIVFLCLVTIDLDYHIKVSVWQTLATIMILTILGVASLYCIATTNYSKMCIVISILYVYVYLQYVVHKANIVEFVKGSVTMDFAYSNALLDNTTVWNDKEYIKGYISIDEDCVPAYIEANVLIVYINLNHLHSETSNDQIANISHVEVLFKEFVRGKLIVDLCQT